MFKRRSSCFKKYVILGPSLVDLPECGPLFSLFNTSLTESCSIQFPRYFLSQTFIIFVSIGTNELSRAMPEPISWTTCITTCIAGLAAACAGPILAACSEEVFPRLKNFITELLEVRTSFQNVSYS